MKVKARAAGINEITYGFEKFLNPEDGEFEVEDNDELFSLGLIIPSSPEFKLGQQKKFADKVQEDSENAAQEAKKKVKEEADRIAKEEKEKLENEEAIKRAEEAKKKLQKGTGKR